MTSLALGDVDAAGVVVEGLETLVAVDRQLDEVAAHLAARACARCPGRCRGTTTSRCPCRRRTSRSRCSPARSSPASLTTTLVNSVEPTASVTSASVDAAAVGGRERRPRGRTSSSRASGRSSPQRRGPRRPSPPQRAPRPSRAHMSPDSVADSSFSAASHGSRPSCGRNCTHQLSTPGPAAAVAAHAAALSGRCTRNAGCRTITLSGDAWRRARSARSRSRSKRARLEPREDDVDQPAGRRQDVLAHRAAVGPDDAVGLQQCPGRCRPAADRSGRRRSRSCDRDRGR